MKLFSSNKTLLRWRTSKGFGVQSPSAYHFIKFVVGESWPYYCYQDIEAKYSSLPHHQQNLLKLLFRLSNFWQADYAFMDDKDGLVAEMIALGCGKTAIRYDDGFDFKVGSRYIYKIRCRKGCLAALIAFVEDQCKDDAHECLSRVMLIVDGINVDDDAKREWVEIQLSEWTVRTFDVVDFGIVFFEGKRLKEHYFIDI